MLPLVSPESAILRRPADTVTVFDDTLGELIGQMFQRVVVDGWDVLSAPQLGRPLRVIVYRIDGHQGYLVNPRIERADGELDAPDICPSTPDDIGVVRRPMSIVVSGVDTERRPVFVRAFGRGAHALHHELDHLDGTAHPDGGADWSPPAD